LRIGFFPLDRLAQSLGAPVVLPREPKKAALFLASSDSSYINAVELMVDGGATGAPFAAPILRG
jgi:hypothetical protein